LLSNFTELSARLVATIRAAVRYIQTFYVLLLRAGKSEIAVLLGLVAGSQA
jgi:hypothetical protein